MDLQELSESLQVAVEDCLEDVPMCFMGAAFELYLKCLYEVREDSVKAWDIDHRGYMHKHEEYVVDEFPDFAAKSIAHLIRNIIWDIGDADVIITWRRPITWEGGRASCRLSLTPR